MYYNTLTFSGMHIWSHLQQTHAKSMKSIQLFDTCKNCKIFQSKTFITQHVERCIKYFKYVTDNRCTICLEQFKSLKSAYHHIDEKHQNVNKDELSEKNRQKIQEDLQQNFYKTKVNNVCPIKKCKHCHAPRTNITLHEKKCAIKAVHIKEKNNTCKLCHTEFPNSREMAFKHVGFAHRALIYKNVDGNRFKTPSSSTTNR